MARPVDVATMPPLKDFSLGGFVQHSEELLKTSQQALKFHKQLSSKSAHKKVSALNLACGWGGH
jgi:hypothetical protein